MLIALGAQVPGARAYDATAISSFSAAAGSDSRIGNDVLTRDSGGERRVDGARFFRI
jgi:hypothetical protein